VSLRSLLSAVAPPLCAGCGARAGRAEPLCSDCRRSLRWIGATLWADGVPVWVALTYEGGARALVSALKFRRVAGVAATMAAQLAAGAPDDLLAGAALVPVPIHPARLRRRGFNQAELLAREIGVRRACPVADCLARVGPRGAQVGRGRAERLAAVHVRVRPGAVVPPRVLVVDDVMTTGATVRACAAALGSACAGALVYAHTPGK
jgi:predicted amidophosphoribosyltransferase